MLDSAPHSVEAEQAVIGGLMIDNDKLALVRQVLEPADFYRGDHRRIHNAILALADEGSPFDAVTLAEHMDRSGELERVGGIGYLGKLAQNTPSAANVAHYAAIVKERAERRRVMVMAQQIQDRAATAPLNELRAEMAKAADLVPGRSKRLPVLTYAALQAALPPLSWRIKGILPAHGVAMIWGASTTGKTFLALHQAAHIAEGCDWFGYRVNAAPVAYCGLEGEHGIPNRAAALAHGFGDLASIRFVLQPFDLLNDSDVESLISSLLEAGMGGGVVFIDTLARAAIGDENSAEYGASVLAACKRLQAALDGLVVVVHHTGKDASKGLRGHSSIFAGLDAGIEVTRDSTGRAWRVAKAKDGVDDKSHAFALRVIELGTDDDGDPITSCAVAPVDGGEQNGRRIPGPTGGNQKIIWDALGELFKQSHHHGQGGAPENRAAVRLEDAIPKIRGHLPCPTDRQTERTRQAITGLISKGNLVHKEGWVWCA